MAAHDQRPATPPRARSMPNSKGDFRIEYTELDALTEINEMAQSYAGAENKACPQTPAGDPTLISTNGKGGVNK